MCTLQSHKDHYTFSSRQSLIVDSLDKPPDFKTRDISSNPSAWKDSVKLHIAMLSLPMTADSHTWSASESERSYLVAEAETDDRYQDVAQNNGPSLFSPIKTGLEGCWSRRRNQESNVPEQQWREKKDHENYQNVRRLNTFDARVDIKWLDGQRRIRHEHGLGNGQNSS